MQVVLTHHRLGVWGEAQAVRVLDDEAGEDAGARAKHGGGWNRPQSSTLAAPMRERLETYRHNLTQAEVRYSRSICDEARLGLRAVIYSSTHES